MRSHSAGTRRAARPGASADASGSPSAAGADQVEAALVEHYPRLVRLAYLILPPSLGRSRRVLTAHAIVQRSLPRGRGRGAESSLPGPRRMDGGGQVEDPRYALLRARVLRQALDAGLPLRRFRRPKRAQLPVVLPRVWGLRLAPHQGGAAELALDQRLGRMPGGARAAFVLRGLEGLPDPDVRRALGAAGVAHPAAALARAGCAGVAGLDGTGAAEDGGVDVSLLRSPEFDACSLRAQPTDLVLRRRHGKAALAAVAAVVVCGALLALPGHGWGPDEEAAPSSTLGPASVAALDPGKVVRVPPATWRDSPRTDFSVWPARGSLARDTGLLRRALDVWARPGGSVRVSRTPGTPSGPPVGPPQLLFAGTVDGARVVMFYDGLRIARYAEPVDGGAAAALDFARVDGAGEDSSDAVVVARSDGNVRYLTAPWVTATTVRDLLTPNGDARPLHRDKDGVTDPLGSPALARTCASWDTLDVRGDGLGGAARVGGERLLTDLGELTPARLTSGSATSARDVSSAADRASWARTACLLPAMRGHGVRSVNSWQYAEQPLPEKNGTAKWVCTRGETWQGKDSRVLAQFQAPSAKDGNPGAIAASSADSAACGTKDPEVLAGVLWKSKAGQWYLLAAGSDQFASLSTTGGLRANKPGRLMSVKAGDGIRAELKGRLKDGTTVNALR